MNPFITGFRLDLVNKNPGLPEIEQIFAVDAKHTVGASDVDLATAIADWLVREECPRYLRRLADMFRPVLVPDRLVHLTVDICGRRKEETIPPGEVLDGASIAADLESTAERLAEWPRLRNLDEVAEAEMRSATPWE